jgi:hypothetical protein
MAAVRWIRKKDGDHRVDRRTGSTKEREKDGKHRVERRMEGTK